MPGRPQPAAERSLPEAAVAARAAAPSSRQLAFSARTLTGSPAHSSSLWVKRAAPTSKLREVLTNEVLEVGFNGQ